MTLPLGRPRITTSRATYRLRNLADREHLWPILLIFGLVLFVNGPLLLEVVTNNPTQLFSHLADGTGSTIAPGLPFIDPNAFNISQTLGHRVSQDWLSGTIPWWNPYEGMGMPLAGEMQSAAFFPLTLLLVNAFGFVVFHLLLELLAGWCTYFLLRRLGVARLPATSGGIAFAFCGTLAWFQHAPANPVPFLPMAILGVERCRQHILDGRRGGWRLLAIGLALSIVAGFIEVTYIDGLLLVVWAIVRLGCLRSAWWPTVRKVAAAGVVALMLCAPVVVAFLDFTPHAFTGSHASDLNVRFLGKFMTAQLVLPYGFGPIFGYTSSSISDMWGNVGGYFGAAPIFLALVGLTGRRIRPLRILLGIWLLLMLGRTYGLGAAQAVVNHFPGMSEVAAYRYAAPSWIFAAVVLAALTLDDLRRREVHPGVLLSVAGLVLAYIWWAGSTAWRMIAEATGPTGAHGAHRWPIGSAAFAVAVVLTVLIGGLLSRSRSESRHAVMATVGEWMAPTMMSFEAALLFALPLLSSPTPVPINDGVAKYLQVHLGIQRFVTLGPLQPNLGSSYGISSLSIIDLPIPEQLERKLAQLDPNRVVPNQMAGAQADPSKPSAGEYLTANIKDYESLGVSYVIVNANGTDLQGHPWPPNSLKPAPLLVYSDNTARLYQLPKPTPVFSTHGGHCTLINTLEIDHVVAHCTAPTALTRLQQTMPGWSATVNGRPVILRNRADGLAQTVALRAGTSTVAYSFTPPRGTLALIAAAVGCAALILTGLVPIALFRQVAKSRSFWRFRKASP